MYVQVIKLSIKRIHRRCTCWSSSRDDEQSGRPSEECPRLTHLAGMQTATKLQFVEILVLLPLKSISTTGFPLITFLEVWGLESPLCSNLENPGAAKCSIDFTDNWVDDITYISALVRHSILGRKLSALLLALSKTPPTVHIHASTSREKGMRVEYKVKNSN